MIIRKKSTKEQNEKDVKNTKTKSGKKIIKAEQKSRNTLKQMAMKKKAEIERAQIEQEFEPDNIEPVTPKEENLPKKSELEMKIEELDKIDVSINDFRERYERRRGERRRGFRRIDERALVSRAQEEAQNIREIAAREGYKTGLLEAESELDDLKNQIKDFTEAKSKAYEEISSHILEIALAVAKKIIKKEVELSENVLKSVMKEVFSELSAGEEKVIVKVNPEDVEFAKASLPEILADSAIDARITVVPEKLVEKGSCTVVANNGVIDANFSTQLSIIQNAFGIYKGGE